MRTRADPWLPQRRPLPRCITPYRALKKQKGREVQGNFQAISPIRTVSEIRGEKSAVFQNSFDGRALGRSLGGVIRAPSCPLVVHRFVEDEKAKRSRDRIRVHPCRSVVAPSRSDHGVRRTQTDLKRRTSNFKDTFRPFLSSAPSAKSAVKSPRPSKTASTVEPADASEVGPPSPGLRRVHQSGANRKRPARGAV